MAIPLAIWFGILTIISLFITALFGLLTYKYNKNLFKIHITFAFITLALAIIHLVFAYLLFFKGISF